MMWKGTTETGFRLAAHFSGKDIAVADRALLERLSRALTEQGLLIEAGWVGYRLAVISPDAPAIELEECKLAFFAGAQHLFSSIMTILDSDREPTADDMRRMSLISDELEEFGNKLKEEVFGKPN